MPRAVWEKVGEMDTRYEIGMFEDDDLTLRVREAGFGSRRRRLFHPPFRPGLLRQTLPRSLQPHL